MKKVIFSVSLFILLVLIACQAPDEKEDAPVLVTIGDSITMGIQDAGLIDDYQSASYPYLVARQLGIEADFHQPLVTTPGIGVPPYAKPLTLNGTTIVSELLATDANGRPVISINSMLPLLPTVAYAEPYNNLGISGAKLLDLRNTMSYTDPDAAGNFFFDLVLRTTIPSLAGKTVIQQAAMLNPDFILLWIGNNDILQAELKGCGVNGLVDGVAFPRTDPATFQTEYEAILTNLQANTPARIVMANIPDWLPFTNGLDGIFKVDSTFFAGHLMIFNPTTFEPILFDLNADGTGDTYIPLFLEETDARHLLLTGATAYMEEGQGIPSQDDLEYMGIATGTATNMVAALSTVMGLQGITIPASAVALTGDLTITEAEQGAALSIIEQYNTAISALGVSLNIPVVDIAGDWWGADTATTTTPFGGYSGEFVLRAKDTTVFSLDGVHPNNLGQALCANSFIRVLNAEYGLDLDELAPASYAGQYSARAIDSRSLLRSIRGMAVLP